MQMITQKQRDKLLEGGYLKGEFNSVYIASRNKKGANSKTYYVKDSLAELAKTL